MRTISSGKNTDSFTLHDVTRMREFYLRSESPLSNVDPYIFFTLANNVFPSLRSIGELVRGWDKVTRLRNCFRVSDENCFSSERYISDQNKFGMIQTLVMVARNLMVEFTVENGSPTAKVLYSHETNQEMLSEVCDLLKDSIQKSDLPHIGFLSINSCFGIQLTNIEIEQQFIDLDALYNNDLKQVNETITEKLNKQNGKGVVLLHGLPGTGKTTYIRHLANKVRKQLIYIPIEVAQRISAPDFISFLSDHKDSVLILEDSESLLKSREDGENLTVAGLLNLSDGLLSDALHMQIVCTFNTSIIRLDKALLRKGRTIARYEFRPLSIEKSARLAASIGINEKIDRPMTLAEIFNYKDEDISIRENRKIGFRPLKQ